MEDQALHLEVRVLSPRKLIYNGQAASISSTNSVGNFDILPEHANFITIVENKPITVRVVDGPEHTFNFPLAIIHTINNRVDIYTDIQDFEKLN